MSRQLDENFLIDLAKICIVDANVTSVLKSHLQYSYIENEQYKHIFKYIFDFYGAHKKNPTIGQISQHLNDRDSLALISRIREANVFDNKDQIISDFEEYIRRSRFIENHKLTAELFKAGKYDEAYSEYANNSINIKDFSLKRKMHSRIFADFDKRQRERANRDFVLRKVPTGIPAFDYHTRGGIDRGSAFLGIARSGVGKTTLLRSLGGNAAIRGINVLHIAAGDSTKQEVEDGYDSWWTGVELNNIRENNFEGADMKQIEKAKASWLAQCGEIFVHVFNQFHSASILDCRSLIIDLKKECDIGLVLFDYLEMFEPGDGKRYSTNQDGVTSKKKAVAEKIVSVATELDVAAAAVTQASDIKKELWNNPNWVITRNDIANLKATVDPFQYSVTLNQTEDENDEEIMRVHEEKLRHYKIYSYSSTYHIAQRRDVGRFIDVGETKRRFWDDEKKQIIRRIIKKD